MTYGGTTYAGTTYGGTTTSGRVTALVNSIDTDTALTQGVRVRAGTSTSTDTDTATTTVTRNSIIASTDTDVAAVSPLRERLGRLTGVDTDTSTTVVTRYGGASAVDTETAILRPLILPITDANDPVQATVDILSGLQNPNTPFYNPEEPGAIAPLSQNRPKARKGEEKAIWVWSSASTDIDDFDAEYSRTTRTATVEAILQLNQSDRQDDFADIATFAEDVVQLLSKYARDNKTKTQFHSIKVVQREDRRAQNIPTNSLPYDVALTIELSRLVETR